MSDSSENFRTIPHPSEVFGNLPNLSERKENHILTAREVTRMFEEDGVPRTERSVINWCHPDKHGVSRLDAYFDANERKYFITPQSVERAIKEEQAKAKSEHIPGSSEPFRNAPGRPSSETVNAMGNAEAKSVGEEERTLRAKVRRLTLEGEVSKRYIEKLESEREKFLDRMMDQSRQIGVLETQLLQLEAPKRGAPRVVETSHEHETTYHDIPLHRESDITEP